MGKRLIAYRRVIRPKERFEADVRSGCHASTRTTQLYDRRRDEVSLDEVERIVI